MHTVKKFDVTVSVWNEFWGRELCLGLTASGLKTEAIRNHFRPIPGVPTRASFLSHGLQRLVARGGRFSGQLLEATQDTFESFAAKYAGNSKLFWGWNGHSLAAFKKAASCGSLVICDRGSTHADWAARRLNAVHRELGWGDDAQETTPRHKKALREYEVADKIVIPSNFVRKTFLEEDIPEEKLFVIPYGIDAETWSQVRGSKRDSGPLVFVFTAAVGPRKGFHILLRAWERAALKNAELWVCGGVHFPIRELGLPVSASVKFLGHQSHAQIADIYDRASVYLLPSFEEGLARSGLEAMAAGLPLIITEETGLTDVMTPGRHGWVVESGNVACLVETLRNAVLARDRLPIMSADCQSVGITYTKAAYGERAAKFAKRILES